MKISEMSNDQACEAITRLCGPVARLCEDPEVKNIMDEIQTMGENGENSIAAVARVLPRMVGFALKTHKDDLYEIVGALNEMPTAKVGKLSFAATVKMVRESWDEIIASFFPSSGKQMKTDTEE